VRRILRISQDHIAAFPIEKYEWRSELTTRPHFIKGYLMPLFNFGLATCGALSAPGVDASSPDVHICILAHTDVCFSAHLPWKPCVHEPLSQVWHGIHPSSIQCMGVMHSSLFHLEREAQRSGALLRVAREHSRVHCDTILENSPSQWVALLPIGSRYVYSVLLNALSLLSTEPHRVNVITRIMFTLWLCCNPQGLGGEADLLRVARQHSRVYYICDVSTSEEMQPTRIWALFEEDCPALTFANIHAERCDSQDVDIASTSWMQAHHFGN
jgi:hypothetical protein